MLIYFLINTSYSMIYSICFCIFVLQFFQCILIVHLWKESLRRDNKQVRSRVDNCVLGITGKNSEEFSPINCRNETKAKAAG